MPTEPLPKDPRNFAIELYRFKSWADIFTPRQLLSIITFVKWVRIAGSKMLERGYLASWEEAVIAYLAAVIDKASQYNSTICTWHNSGEYIRDTFARFALSITWDFAELPLSNSVGGAYQAQLEWVIRAIEHLLISASSANKPEVYRQSATDGLTSLLDAVITDPPYYDAIPYADLSDFFYIWLRRAVGDRYPTMFASSLTQKEDELVQQSKQEGRKDKKEYEAGMAQAFSRASEALNSDGRMVVVFAHKEPDAWETLVTAIIQAGFTVTASWPIDTEMTNRSRANNSAALSSSIWLVCRKRPAKARIGRYRGVRKAMEKRITERLRYFWDIGLSGPDFVWAAIGPALESYSSHKAVKRLDGSPFTVSDFLKEVRRMVADFALGRILKGRSTEGLDEWTRYYLMHRRNFGLEDAPVGECILLSQGYGLDLNDLRTARGFIEKASSSKVRLAKWDERTRDDLGDPHPSGGLPIIDMLHRLMHLWAAGNLDDLNNYAAERGLSQNELFWSIAQAILEMANAGDRERTLLEALVAWGRGQKAASVVESVPLQRKLEM